MATLPPSPICHNNLAKLQELKVEHVAVEKHLASQVGVQKQAQLRNMAALPEVIPKATEDRLAHHPVATVATDTAKVQNESVDNQADVTTYAQYKNSCKHSMNRACLACIEAEYSKAGSLLKILTPT